MAKQSLIALAAGLCLALGALSARAALITLDATARGHYQAEGGTAHAGTYYVGDVRFPGESDFGADNRNWFRFDLSSVDAAVLAATLLLDNPPMPNEPFGIQGYGSQDGSETYSLFDVSPASAALLGTNSSVVWADLGTGLSYGAYVATFADNGTTVAILLNAGAVAAINAALALDSNFEIGGAITTLNTDADEERLFFGAGSSWFAHNTRLQLTIASAVEPSTLALLLIAFAGVALNRAAN